MNDDSPSEVEGSAEFDADDGMAISGGGETPLSPRLNGLRANWGRRLKVDELGRELLDPTEPLRCLPVLDNVELMVSDNVVV